MNAVKGWTVFFFIAGLAIVAGVGILQHAPGYMDAEYYYAGATFLAEGKGFHQPFLWNYLDQVPSLPSPSHTYWMPLVSILAAPGYALLHTFTGSRLLLWLLAAFVPPITFFLGSRLHGKLELAITGGFLALFPAFYMVYLPGTDSFAITMLLGSAFLFIAARENRHSLVQALILGLLAGLLHMTRADGILWLGAALAWFAWRGWRSRNDKPSWFTRSLLSLVICLGGYLLIASPWYARNLYEFGQLMPPGGSKSIWLTSYEDLFIYPPSLLTITRWLDAGWQNIVAGWAKAFSTNLQTFFAVQGSTVLAPFILVGFYRLRKHALIQLATILWLVTFLIFTVVFPYPGMNGSFFHSGAAFQPVFWAAAPVGIAWLVETVARLRKWERGWQVQRFVEILLVGICFILTAGMFYQRIVGTETTAPWGGGSAEYQNAERILLDHSAPPDAVVMVNDPPGYYLLNGRPAIVLPFGDEAMLINAANAYHARYLILDANISMDLARLYFQPGTYPGFRFIADTGVQKIYEFISDK